MGGGGVTRASPSGKRWLATAKYFSRLRWRRGERNDATATDEDLRREWRTQRFYGMGPSGIIYLRFKYIPIRKLIFNLQMESLLGTSTFELEMFR